MATLHENIVQALNDFDAIKEAIVEKGVEVPDRAPTSEYADRIREIDGENLDAFISGSLSQVSCSLEIIPDFAFSAKSNLEEVNLPNATYIGKFAFSSAAGAASGSGGGSSDGGGEGEDSEMIFDNRKLKTVTMPNITNIDYGAFSGAENIEISDLPESLLVLQDRAFEGCNTVQVTSLPENITYIGDNALPVQENLDLATVPPTVTYIGSGITDVQLHTYFEQFVVNDVLDLNSIPKFWFEVELGDSVALGGRFAGFNLGSTLTVPDGVTHIASKLFIGAMQGVEHIIIPDSVITIGEYSFVQTFDSDAGCPASTIALGQNVTSIGEGAFQQLYNVSNLVIPDSVISIGDGAFRGTQYDTVSALASLTLGSNLQDIGSYAFAHHPNIASIVIPDSVTYLGYAAFNGHVSTYGIADMLTSLTVGSNITQLQGQVFASHPNVEVFNIDFSKIIRYGDRCLQNLGCNSNLQFDIALGSNVEAISGQAFMSSAVHEVIWDVPQDAFANYQIFRDCKKLTSFIIGDQVQRLPSDILIECQALQTFVVGKSLVELPTILRHSDLTTIQVDAENTTFDSRDNCNALIETETNILRLGCATSVIPESVATIGEYAFFGVSITTLIFPENVLRIEMGAFIDCIALELVVLPVSLSYIGGRAFAYSTYWDEHAQPHVIVNSRITNFDELNQGRIFSDGTTIYANDESTGHDYANYRGYMFKSLDLNQTISWNIYNHTLALSGSGSTPDYATSGYSPDSRPWNAFDSIIDTIQISDNITSIGNCIFANMSCVSSVDLGTTLETIGINAFRECSNLENVLIPASVSSLLGFGKYCNPFAYCSSLTSIQVDPNNEIFDSRNNCNAIIETSSNSLTVGCSTTVISDTVSVINLSAFEGMAGMTTITIPEGVEYIRDRAFFGCTSLSTVTLPSTLVSISSGAFINSTYPPYPGGLLRLDLTAVTTVITISISGIYGSSIYMQDAGVIVFSDSSVMNAYIADVNWNTYESHFIEE